MQYCLDVIYELTTKKGVIKVRFSLAHNLATCEDTISSSSHMNTPFSKEKVNEQREARISPRIYT